MQVTRQTWVQFPGSGRSAGGGNGSPLQYSCLGNPMDRWTWPAAVHGVAEELEITKRVHTHTVITATSLLSLAPTLNSLWICFIWSPLWLVIENPPRLQELTCPGVQSRLPAYPWQVPAWRAFSSAESDPPAEKSQLLLENRQVWRCLLRCQGHCRAVWFFHWEETGYCLYCVNTFS